MDWKKEGKEFANEAGNFLSQDVKHNAKQGVAPLNGLEVFIILFLMVSGGLLWGHLIGGADTSPNEDTTAAISFSLGVFKLLSLLAMVIVPPIIYTFYFRLHRFVVHTQVDGITRGGRYIKRKLK